MAQARVDQAQTPSPPQPLTVEAYMALPDKRAEVVNGEVMVMSPQGYQSVEIGQALLFSWEAHLRGKKMGKAFIEMPYVLDADDRTNWVKGARVPDVSLVALDRLEAHIARYGKKGPIRLAPDIAVEIVSPTDDFSDVMLKVADYLRYGVRLVILIDPQTRQVHVFSPDHPDGRILREADTLSGAPVLPDWSIPIAELLDPAVE